MTVQEVLEQAKTLNASERKELVKLLVDTLDVETATNNHAKAAETEGHWGKNLVQVLEQTDLADWGDPDIEDPVEAVEALRRQDLSRLDDYWSGKA